MLCNLFYYLQGAGTYILIGISTCGLRDILFIAIHALFVTIIDPIQILTINRQGFWCRIASFERYFIFMKLILIEFSLPTANDTSTTEGVVNAL